MKNRNEMNRKRNTGKFRYVFRFSWKHYSKEAIAISIVIFFNKKPHLKHFCKAQLLMMKHNLRGAKFPGDAF